MSTQMQSVLSTQNVALPTGFAKPKKIVNKPTLMFSDEQEEWDSFLSSTQVEMWGSERYEQHPMNSVFKLYLEALQNFGSDHDDDEQMDVCGYTECDTLIPEYLDEETGDLIDGRDEYCSDTCRDAQQKEDWYTAEDDARCVAELYDSPPSPKKTGEDRTLFDDGEVWHISPASDPLVYWGGIYGCRLLSGHPVANIMKRPSSLALASLLSNYYEEK